MEKGKNCGTRLPQFFHGISTLHPHFKHIVEHISFFPVRVAGSNPNPCRTFSHISILEYYVFTKNSKSDDDERGHCLRFFHMPRRGLPARIVSDNAKRGCRRGFE